MATTTTTHFLPSLHPPTRAQPQPKPTRTFTVKAGPRDNRPALSRGRVLSSEAILAVQSIKRAHKTSNQSELSRILSRLLKSDLLATIRELLRQGHCTLAMQALSTVKSDPLYKTTNPSLYADIVRALHDNGEKEKIDGLVEEMEREWSERGVGFDWEDKRGLKRFLRAVIGAGRKDATVRIWRLMRKCGWGSDGGVEVDEYLGEVLSSGLKKFGEVEVGNEVDAVVKEYLDACLANGGGVKV